MAVGIVARVVTFFEFKSWLPMLPQLLEPVLVVYDIGCHVVVNDESASKAGFCQRLIRIFTVGATMAFGQPLHSPLIRCTMQIIGT